MATRLLAALSLALLALPARAHEVLHEVRRDRAVAVHVFESDGDPVAGATAEVFSPADASAPFWKGRTDRNGWLAFVPDVPGRWRVRVVDDGGHGIDTTVEIDRTAAPPGAPAPGDSAAAGAVPPWLRPVVGVALVAAIFGVLAALGRRKSR